MLSYKEWKDKHFQEIGAGSAVTGVNLGPEISWVGAPSGGTLKSASGGPIKKKKKKKSKKKK